MITSARALFLAAKSHGYNTCLLEGIRVIMASRGGVDQPALIGSHWIEHIHPYDYEAAVAYMLDPAAVEHSFRCQDHITHEWKLFHNSKRVFGRYHVCVYNTEPCHNCCDRECNCAEARPTTN